MSADRPLECLCVGLIVADFVSAPIAEMPPSGGLASTARIEFTIGGCGANVATDLSRVGVAAGMVGCVGDDAMGEHVLASLRHEGVDCSQVHIQSKVQTSATLIVNVKGEDRRFIHAAGANELVTGKEIDLDLFPDLKAIYVGGFGLNPALSGSNVRTLFEQAQERGIITVLDVVLGERTSLEMIAEPLPATDFFFPNNDEAEALLDTSDSAKQARRFRDLGASAVVVTSGADGAILSTASHTLFAPAFPVSQVDGTGGGDAFLTGFLLAKLQAADDRTCLTYGAALGASCVQAPGATTGVFNRQQLENFLVTHQLKIQEIE